MGRTAGHGSGPASTRAPREALPQPDPRPVPPRRARTHSLRCRPPPPQLGLARLGLRISARPADLSASMTAAAGKTQSAKTFRRGRAARAPRSSSPAPASRDVRRSGRGEGGQAPPAGPPPSPSRRDSPGWAVALPGLSTQRAPLRGESRRPHTLPLPRAFPSRPGGARGSESPTANRGNLESETP